VLGTGRGGSSPSFASHKKRPAFWLRPRCQHYDENLMLLLPFLVLLQKSCLLQGGRGVWGIVQN